MDGATNVPSALRGCSKARWSLVVSWTPCESTLVSWKSMSFKVCPLKGSATVVVGVMVVIGVVVGVNEMMATAVLGNGCCSEEMRILLKIKRFLSKLMLDFLNILCYFYYQKPHHHCSQLDQLDSKEECF